MFARTLAFRVLAQPCPKASPLRFCSPNVTSRYFSSSIIRSKAAGKVAPQKQPPFQSPSKPSSPHKASPQTGDTLKFAGRRPTGSAKLDRKVAREGELVLFKAPSHRSYILGAYGIAFFCFAYSVYNSNAVIRDPVVPYPKWQQGLLAGICVTMSVMGTVFLFKTGRLVKGVKAISKDGQTYLRFSVRHIIPFRKPLEFDTLPRQIAFTRRLVVSPEALRGQQRLVSQEAAKSRSGSLLKAPFKNFSKLLWGLFRSIRQIFTQEDFILLEVEGRKGVYRMDSSGYLSEDFLVIGDPVSLRR
ncbi:hypothetical protein BJX61DRAFT_514376 [Aspergillus egyptiacus]|nr:hypothetical protein BJX61DRAFT_514376 [Aspergillus egyptiacus]